jgi:hypothetical protein
MVNQEKIDRYFASKLKTVARDWKDEEHLQNKNSGKYKARYNMVREIAEELTDLSEQDFISIEKEAEEYVKILYGDERIKEIDNFIKESLYDMRENRLTYTSSDIRAGNQEIMELEAEKRELIEKAKELEVFNLWRL